MVALFLGLRLYAVLGKRTGHEPVLRNPAEERPGPPLTLARNAEPRPDFRDAFVEAIKARKEAGHVLDNRLVTIERAIITDASVDNKIARVTVAFDADIAAVTRDADGNVVAGSLTDAVETHDVWTFTRPLRSGDPDWKLADTDEA
jgi:predicted lipid-binding transport protein (Tim44 family)